MADEESTSERDEETQEQDDDKPQGAEIPPEVRAALKKANKEAETLRRRLKEREDADKSEQERANERASDAEKRAEAAEARYLRLKVGATAGLPPSLAERLQGADEDEMLDDAKRLQEALGSTGAKPPADAFDARRGSGDGGGEPDVNHLIRERMKR